jgi:putative transposase
MGVADVRKTKQFEDDVRRLKQLVADLSLDKQMLQEALSRKW